MFVLKLESGQLITILTIYYLDASSQRTLKLFPKLWYGWHDNLYTFTNSSVINYSQILDLKRAVSIFITATSRKSSVEIRF